MQHARAATHGRAPPGRTGVDYCTNDSVTSHSREFTAVFLFALARYVRARSSRREIDVRNYVFLLDESAERRYEIGVALRAIRPTRRLTPASTVSHRSCLLRKCIISRYYIGARVALRTLKSVFDICYRAGTGYRQNESRDKRVIFRIQSNGKQKVILYSTKMSFDMELWLL